MKRSDTGKVDPEKEDAASSDDITMSLLLSLSLCLCGVCVCFVYVCAPACECIPHMYKCFSLFLTNSRVPESQDGFKKGYLTKMGAVRKNWKKRYFVLREDCLYYYREAKVGLG